MELELSALVGKPSSRVFRYNRFERKLLKDTLELCREGAKPCNIDTYVRERLKAQSLESEIIHASGHGVGLKLHESPILEASGDGIAEKPLQCGQTLAIEPGFHFRKRYGFRGSVTVNVGRNGPRVSASFPDLQPV